MYGANNLPNKPLNQQTIVTNGSFTGMWRKPTGAYLVHILCVGGGGGGAAGVAGVAGSSRNGGGGGGSGGLSVGIWPACVLPDELFVATATGGAGGTSAAPTGASGGTTYVSTVSRNANFGVLMQGNAGGGATTAAGGTAGGVWTRSNACPTSWLGVVQLIAGTAGGTPSTAAGGSTTPTNFLCQGLAGGGCAGSTASNGGSFTAYDSFLGLPGGVAGATSLAGSSANLRLPDLYGPIRAFPVFLGGAGGASANAATGGDGGKGAYGCGGGGGGAGVTGGAGGDGGSGLVVITTW